MSVQYHGVADLVAARFHETYERLAPDFGYSTRAASSVPWDEVPDANRRLMRAVVQELLDQRVITILFPGHRDPADALITHHQEQT